ncbi:prepilin-type N-terminal cleavage/methylation domain-containing protein [Verrucomicrobium sp. BvORR106]|uniref:prepilin-type N-terminal cleavage/methylation domain-containing protein n=1 Tax=Verrucomicrobium sp. BvORR106 TaxID=1403819 RepID=UPI0005705AF4|nr:prepilin-type N-terminal cleavage/methylation domain-containing protein [Verrucomicrobium sp. BvORR106]
MQPRTFSSRPARLHAAFSLVEMLAAVAIIGIIAFLAIPNLVKMRGDSERNIAIARAESINMGMATFIQVRGRTQAVADWTAATTDQLKYVKIAPYISFSETNLTDFMPNGYSVTFRTIDPLAKVTLKQGTTVINY